VHQQGSASDHCHIRVNPVVLNDRGAGVAVDSASSIGAVIAQDIARDPRAASQIGNSPAGGHDRSEVGCQPVFLDNIGDDGRAGLRTIDACSKTEMEYVYV